jgi:tRNA (cmo5U34)-methyltransferase
MTQPASPSRFDAQSAASYDERWAPLAPMRDSLHLQISLVLRDLPADARVLCVGVGTGPELAALARRFPNWRFIACDPSAPMLDQCRRRAEAEGFSDRCEFHVCYVHELPPAEPVHAVTTLLVSHFIVDPVLRLNFFREAAARLRPGGLLVTADLCCPDGAPREPLLDAWRQMMRFVGADEEKIKATVALYGSEVSIQTPAKLISILSEAGFANPVQFCQNLLIHAFFARRQN